MSILGVFWVSYLTLVYGCFAFSLAQTPGGAKLGLAVAVVGALGTIGSTLYMVLSLNQREA